MFARKIKVAMVFEHPGDEALTMASETTESYEELGLTTASMAQVTVFREETGEIESSVFLSLDELRRHVFEARTIMRTLDEARKLVDGEWKGYRDAARRRNDQVRDGAKDPGSGEDDGCGGEEKGRGSGGGDGEEEGGGEGS